MEENALHVRRNWLGVLAKGDPDSLERALSTLEGVPGFSYLRPPETGLSMVRGRIGGTGVPFNLGEMTVTRCTVRMDSGYVGTGYVAGRNHRHAELVALFDALFQDPDSGARYREAVLPQQERELLERRKSRERKTAATRVDFFTMVRGEDQ
jgi:alpha-D-ribose 1-methylphosphonate 5-triphosphate synthase subunit PhnG